MQILRIWIENARILWAENTVLTGTGRKQVLQSNILRIGLREAVLILPVPRAVSFLQISQLKDCEQVRPIKQFPARQIVFGVLLCFLAALLAIDAKVAWVAAASSQPNDLTAVKLSPLATNSTEQKAQVSQPDPQLVTSQNVAALQTDPVMPASFAPSSSTPSPATHAVRTGSSTVTHLLRPPPTR